MADDGGRFAAFVTEVEPRLRRALIATYGAPIGRRRRRPSLGYAITVIADRTTASVVAGTIMSRFEIGGAPPPAA